MKLFCKQCVILIQLLRSIAVMPQCDLVRQPKPFDVLNLIFIVCVLFCLFQKTATAQQFHIPEPTPPPAEVSAAFELDTSFYKQWINIGGFPVVASAKVNPYAVKEAAYLVYQMTKHRPDILEALVEARARLAVMATTESLTDIPENRDWPVPYFHTVRGRAIGGSHLVVNEETMLNYPGNPYEGHNSVFHEFAHTMEDPGLKRADPRFYDRLTQAYQAAVAQGSWKGNYTAVNAGEYWAEGSESWFYPNGKTNNQRYGNTREALKTHDPGLTALLIEVYGDDEWQYTPPETRLHQPHLQGFDPQNSPTFQYPPDAVALYDELLWDPESTGDGRWINLEPYPLSELPRLRTLRAGGESSEIIIGNFTGDNVLLVYSIAPNGTEQFRYRLRDDMKPFDTYVGVLWLLKDSDGNNLSVYRAAAKTGRILFLPKRCEPEVSDMDDVVDTSTTWAPGPKIEGPWLWMIAPIGGYSGATAVCSEEDWLAKASGGSVTEQQIAVNGATAGDPVGKKVWTRGSLTPIGGNNITEMVNAIGLGSEDNLHHYVAYGSISLHSPREQKTKMYVGSDDAVRVWLNGELVHNNPADRAAYDYQERFSVTLKQGANILLVAVYNGTWNWSGFFGFENDAEYSIRLPLTGHIGAAQRPPMYWIDAEAGTLHRLINDTVENLLPNVQNAMSLAVDTENGKLYWAEKTGNRSGRIRRANLDGSNVQLVKTLTSVPHGIALDSVNSTIYLTNAYGKVQRLNVDGSNFQSNLITGLNAPNDIVVDSTGSKIYWIEQTNERSGHIRQANLDGSNVQLVKALTSLPIGIALDPSRHKIYVTNAYGKVQSLSTNGSDFQPNLITGLDTPKDVAVDVADSLLYWTEEGNIRRAALNGADIQDVATGLGSPGSIVLGTAAMTPVERNTPAEPVPYASTDVNQDKKVNKTDLLLVITALGETPPTNPNFDVNADGTVNIADMLLVIEDLDDPVTAAAPTHEWRLETSLDPSMLEAQLNILRAENDGSAKYAQAIAFLRGLLASVRPTETQLLANYPNPFNPETWIPYQLRTASDVRIIIYDVQGSVVRRLTLGHQGAGHYTSKERAAYWDGRNAFGEQVASGVYFYQLETNTMSTMRKMVILK